MTVAISRTTSHTQDVRLVSDGAAITLDDLVAFVMRAEDARIPGDTPVNPQFDVTCNANSWGDGEHETYITRITLSHTEIITGDIT